MCPQNDLYNADLRNANLEGAILEDVTFPWEEEPEVVDVTLKVGGVDTDHLNPPTPW